MLPDGTKVKDKTELNNWFENWTPAPTDIAFCNHYMVMSEQYFKECKMKREGGAGRPHDAKSMRKYWIRNNANDESDTLILSTKHHTPE